MKIENKPAPDPGRRPRIKTHDRASSGALASWSAFLSGRAVADPDKTARAGINSFGAKAGNLAAADAIGVIDIVVHSPGSCLLLAGSHKRDSFFATKTGQFYLLLTALNARRSGAVMLTWTTRIFPCHRVFIRPGPVPKASSSRFITAQSRARHRLLPASSTSN